VAHRSPSPQTPLAGRGATRVDKKSWTEEILGWSVEIVRRPPKPIAEKVARIWAEEGENRRMSKDYERLFVTAEAFTYATMTCSIIGRLASA
jgi:hypothetical protein